MLAVIPKRIGLPTQCDPVVKDCTVLDLTMWDAAYTNRIEYGALSCVVSPGRSPNRVGQISSFLFSSSIAARAPRKLGHPSCFL